MYKKGHKHSIEIRNKIRRSKLGDKNHQWVEKNPSYGSVHVWLIRNFKKLKHCEFCPSRRFIEWALKKGKKHNHKRQNYLCLCSSFHKKYDYTLERRKKLSESLKKVPHTKIWIERIGKANKGKRRSLETRLKLSKAYNKDLHPRGPNGRYL